MLHFSGLLPQCKPPLLRILPLLPQSHQGIETLAKAQQLVIISPSPCSLQARSEAPISLMVQPSRAPQPSPYNPRLPLGSARRSFLPSAHPAKGQSINVHHTIYPVSNSPLYPLPIPSHHPLSSSFILEEPLSQECCSSSLLNNGQGEISNALEPSTFDQFNWPTTLNCPISDTRKKQEQETKKGPNLERVAYVLSHDLHNIFLKSQEWEMYHPNMVLQDNIRGKRFEGLDQYMKIVNLLKLTAHLRFVYVRFHILKLTKHPEDGTIRVRWRIAGLGMVRMLVRYFPDKMWMKGNMERAAPSWYDGISTFHVGGDDRIYKHTLDHLEGDNSPVVETLKEKLNKLKPATAEPALGCTSQTL